MNDNDVSLAEFYFYTVGDKTVYNQQLNDLFVCYTLARGLQKECSHPRRSALPLELILRIIRFAGFIDPKPDMNLTLDVSITVKTLAQGFISDLYMTERLTRGHLATMARLQLVESPRDDSEATYDLHNMHPFTWAFVPVGTQNDKPDFTDGPNGMVAALFPCSNEADAAAVQTLSEGVIIADTFTLDHVISQQLEGGEVPCVIVVLRERAKILVWRWWEPKF